MNGTPYNKDLIACQQVLQAGGVILYPTDTVWGLGCDPHNVEAVDRIFQIKGRSKEKKLLVLVSDLGCIKKYTSEIPGDLKKVLDECEGALTIVYNRVSGFAHQVVHGDGSLGIRIPKDDFCQDLLQKINCPLISSSANLSGTPFLGSFRDVASEIIEKVDYVVEWRRAELIQTPPSKILKWKADSGWELIRE